MAKSSRTSGGKTSFEDRIPAETVSDEEHPDYVAGQIADGESGGETDGLSPEGNASAAPLADASTMSRSFSWPFPIPAFCAPVSGRYRYVPFVLSPAGPVVPVPFPGRPTLPRPVPGPVIPINLLSITVRVDVDRFLPQNRISIEWHRRFPNQRAHVIAEVRSDRCRGINTRVVEADIVYRDGDPAAIPATKVVFRASRTKSLHYGAYTLELSGGGSAPQTFNLTFQSDKFDDVEFEVDRVSNAGSIVTAYNTGDHPNRPAGLPVETLSLETVYERSGFNVRMSPNTTVIPTTDAGSNGTWSDTEMHNAMVTYWSRFANKPQWALWVLYAARHDQGRSLGGVMFDDIGANHRQGTAIFTDSFIKDAPSGDPDPAGWRRRMEFWTAVHEMGHAFNLAHSWQKALSGSFGHPWIPLPNEPEARSYMNYPFRVSGGETVFFSDFRFRFTDEELVFMRHAPRRFVQMGNSDWFFNHGFEAPDALTQTGDWELRIRPNRDTNMYRFLEPVRMELKLTNTSGSAVEADPDMLQDGRHVSVYIQREGGETRQWTPMITRCHEQHFEKIDAGESLYGSHLISTATGGFTIDEAGFYKLQAAIDLGGEIVVSNVLRLFVGSPAGNEEASLAPDFFTEDVGRVLSFNGVPALSSAEDLLREVIAKCPDNPATSHAKVALSAPQLRDFKVLDLDAGREGMKLSSVSNKVSKAAAEQTDALLSKPDETADTIGNIRYFAQLRSVAEALEEHGAEDKAVEVMEKSIEVMKHRNILASVIDNAERRLKRRS